MTDLDIMARTAVERARQEAASVDVPRLDDVTTRRATAHRRRRLAGAALATVVVVAGVFAVATTRNGDRKQPGIAVQPTPSSGLRHRSATLEFRAVLATTPRAGCKVTADHPASNSWLRDRDRTACYLVGPVVLDGAGVESADAEIDRTTSEWIINVHFRNDDFLAKVATPFVGRQIAMVVDGVVQSAPNINQGITGRDVTISGNFTRAEAEDLARQLAP